MKIIHEILNKEKKNNYLVTFRGKHVKLNLCDDGYTDASAYYSLKTKQNKRNRDKDPNFAVHSNSNSNLQQNDEQKHESKQNGNNHRSKPKTRSKSNSYTHPESHLQFSRSMPDSQINKFKSISNGNNQSNDTKEDKKNDSMQLLVMRLKSLIENTIQTHKTLESKLRVLSLIDDGLPKTDNNQNKNYKKGNKSNRNDEEEKKSDNDSNDTDDDIDIDVAFGDESYTIDAMKESLEALKNDKNQIQVYKQALTAYETVCTLSFVFVYSILCTLCFNMLRIY